MFRWSAAKALPVLAIGWPLLLTALLYAFPGKDTQSELERRLRPPSNSSTNAPTPSEPARRSGREQNGVRMFWEETGEGKFRGEIYIPPEALNSDEPATLLPESGVDIPPPDDQAVDTQEAAP